MLSFDSITASRDLRDAVEAGTIGRKGDGRTSFYRFTGPRKGAARS